MCNERWGFQHKSARAPCLQATPTPTQAMTQPLLAWSRVSKTSIPAAPKALVV
jgi:hypothetical protein